MLGTFNFNMAELTVFHREVGTVVKIAILTALDVVRKINKNNSTKEPDSTTRVSSWPAKREVNSSHVDNDQRLLWAHPKCYSWGRLNRRNRGEAASPNKDGGQRPSKKSLLESILLQF